MRISPAVEISQERLKERLLKRRERKKDGVWCVCMAVLLNSFTETDCREIQLDTGEDRMSLRMRKGQKNRTYCLS